MSCSLFSPSLLLASVELLIEFTMCFLMVVLSGTMLDATCYIVRFHCGSLILTVVQSRLDCGITIGVMY